MTAPALNTVSPALPGANSPGQTAPGAAAGQAGNPLAGFEALLATLFPQPDLTAACAGSQAPRPNRPAAARARTGIAAKGKDDLVAARDKTPRGCRHG